MRDDMGLFRGKRLDNGEWVYGNLLFKGDGDTLLQITYSCIFDGQAVPVYPETVGEYTGIRDINGKQIFEGDIVKIHSTYAKELAKTFNLPADLQTIAKVEFKDGAFVYSDTSKAWREYAKLSGFGAALSLSLGKPARADVIEVIGNIYDNPEMEEGDK